MTDLAVLGLRFETDGAENATRQLDQVAQKSANAERATDALAGSNRRAGSAIAQMVASIERGVRDLVAMAQATLILANNTQTATAATTVQTTATNTLATAAVAASTANIKFSHSFSMVQTSAAAAAVQIGQADAHMAAYLAQMSRGSRVIGDADAHMVAYRNNLGKVGAAGRLTANEMLNLTRQLSDVGVTAAMGMNPLMILIQQGPQIADTFQTAAQRGVGFSAALRGIWLSLTPLLPLFLGIAAAAAAIAAPFAIAAQQINADNKGLIAGLGLTADQLEKVKDKGVTMGDVLRGTWKTVTDELNERFGKQIAAVQGFFAEWYQKAVDGAVWAVRTIVGAFAGAAGAIGATWRMVPAAIGDAAITAANAVIGAVEGMINGGIRAINRLLPAVNAFQVAMPGPDVLFSSLSEVSIGRLANRLEGSMSRTGEAAGAAYARDFASAAGAVDRILERNTRNILSEASRRIRREAGDAEGGGAAATERAARAVAEIETLWPKVNQHLRETNTRVDKMVNPLIQARHELQLIDDLANDAGRGLADSFGRAGDALAGMVTALSRYRAEIAAVNLAESEGSLNRDQAARERTQLEVRSYGDMASAAKGFFGEKTAAYKALQAVEMAYRAVQFAGAVQAMALDTAETGSSIGNSIARGAAYAAEAVANIFAKLGPWGFPVAAAALGVIAAVGGKAMGGGGSSAVPTLPSTNTGTGTVLGAGGEQSDSLARSLETAERYQNRDLEFSSRSLNALRAIQANIGSLTTAIAREMNVGGGLDPTGLNQGPTTSGGFLGAFSTTRSSELVGSGINLSGGALADLIAQGVSGGLYQIVQTTSRNSGFFGIGASTRTTNNETSTALDGGLSREFSRVLASLRDGVLSAAGDLGLTGAEAVLDAFQVSLGRVDFSGMSSSEISETLNAVFSAVGDDMARAILPGLDAFQRAGEGMLETLTRLATTFTAVDNTLTGIGMLAPASIEARLRLVELSGGLDAFIESADFFAENFLTDAQRIAPIQAAVTAELTRLGVASDISRSGFASLVMGLDVSTDAGSSMFAALMRLAPALDQVISYTDDLTGAVVDAIDLSRQRRSLEIALMEAQGNSSAALAARRADELAAMDASLRPLQELIWTTNDIAEAARLATAAQEEAARAAQAIADQRRSMEITLMELTGDASGALAARRAIELSGMDASLQALQRLIYAQTDLNAANEAAATAANEAAQAAIEREQLLAQYRAQAETDALALVEKARDALSAAYEREAGAIQTTIDKFRGFEEGLRRFRESLGLEGLTPGASLAVSKADFERTSALARVGNEQALGDLQGVSEAYLEQSRASSKTSIDHLRNLGAVREAVQAAEATAGRQASIGEQQLSALNGSVAGLMVLNGSVLSVRDAISALASAQAVLSSVTPGVANDNREWGVNPEVNRLLARQTGYAGDFGSGGFDAWIRTQDEAVKAGARATLAAQGQAYRIGFATGGSFEVGGSGGTDSTPISFMATPGEMVNIRRPGDASNDNDEMRALREEVADLKRAMLQVVVNTGMTARATKNTDDNIDMITRGEMPITTVA